MLDLKRDSSKIEKSRKYFLPKREERVEKVD